MSIVALNDIKVVIDGESREESRKNLQQGLGVLEFLGYTFDHISICLSIKVPAKLYEDLSGTIHTVFADDTAVEIVSHLTRIDSIVLAVMQMEVIVFMVRNFPPNRFPYQAADFLLREIDDQDINSRLLIMGYMSAKGKQLAIEMRKHRIPQR